MTSKIVKNAAYCFKAYWVAFHKVTKQPKLSNIHQAEIEWNRGVIQSKKIELIKSLTPGFKTNLTALELIRDKL